MQTNFRGRDFIGDLDFTKEEVETVLDVAWDLKRKRALGEPHAHGRACIALSPSTSQGVPTRAIRGSTRCSPGPVSQA